MKRINLSFILVFSLLLSCNNKLDKFPIEKKYWDAEDYKNVVGEIKYNYKPDEKLPSLNDDETRVIVEKLIDTKNYEIVLDDSELGLKHRNEVAQVFFDAWRNMTSIYNQTDRKDKFIYETEMIEVQKFGLGLQLRYFKMGNDEIIESSEDPNSFQVKNVIESNTSTLIGNFLFYLDQINNENSFSEKGLNSIAEGIDKYFPQLITMYPNADYSVMENKLVLLEKKSKSEKIKNSLKNIQSLINSSKSKNNTVTLENTNS